MDQSNLKNKRKKIFSTDTLLRYITIIALVMILIVFAFGSDQFAKVSNIVNILSQSSVLGLVAIGLTFIVVIGGVDLSIAAAFGIGGLVSVSLMNIGVGWVPAILATIVVSIIFGLINAFLIVRIRISIWLGTLGTLFIVESIERILTRGGAPIYLPDMPDAFKFLGSGSLLQIISDSMGRVDLKFSVLFVIVIAVIANFILRKTVFGRSLYAIGLQKKAASLSGISADKYVTIAFIISSLLCAFGGMFGSSVLKSYIPVNGRYYLMDAIGAVFIGSTMDKRGYANIPGTLIGVLFFGVMSNGLNLTGISFYWQSIAKGVLIFMILALDSYKTNSLMRVKKKVSGGSHV